MKGSLKDIKAFTLVEIMIVVVIIGLLAAMAIPAMTVVRARSQDKTVTNNLRQIAAAANQYMMESGASTVSLTDIVGTGTDKYISNVSQVADETYTVTISTATTRLTTVVNGRRVIYDF